MKYFLQITTTLILSFLIISCSTENEISENISYENLNIEIANFDTSVAIIIPEIEKIQARSKSVNEKALIIEIRNFNSNFTLQNQYYIDEIQFTDDGKFNDITSGDGIFTSIQTFIEVDKKIEYKEVRIILGENFKFNNELKILAKDRNINLSNSNDQNKSIGCDFRTAPCPETSWWNSCYPLSSPCTCIEFYNCSISIL